MSLTSYRTAPSRVTYVLAWIASGYVCSLGLASPFGFGSAASREETPKGPPCVGQPFDK